MITRYCFGAADEAAFLRLWRPGRREPRRRRLRAQGQLVEQYDNFPLGGGSDASVVAIAERRSITTILTTDRRPFAAVRPKHVEAFELLS